MARNLGYQIENAINSCFGKNGTGGFDKHSMRKNKVNTNNKVFSYGERQGLLETGHNMGRFLKENYPDVNQVSEITPEHVQAYLNHKALTNADTSLTAIKSRLNKLDSICSSRYKSKTESFTDGVKKPTSAIGAGNCRLNVSVTASDWAKIKQAMEGSNSKANILIKLAAAQMLRVESVTNMRVRDFDFKNKVIHIVDDKGKRNRTIPMKDVDVCRKAIGTRGLDEKITTLRPGSVNKQLKRLMEKANIAETYKEAKTGVHALRKMGAIDLARELKDKAFDREAILATVSQQLGHGVSRRDVLKKYLDPETIEYISK